MADPLLLPEIVALVPSLLALDSGILPYAVRHLYARLSFKGVTQKKQTRVQFYAQVSGANSNESTLRHSNRNSSANERGTALHKGARDKIQVLQHVLTSVPPAAQLASLP